MLPSFPCPIRIRCVVCSFLIVISILAAVIAAKSEGMVASDDQAVKSLQAIVEKQGGKCVVQDGAITGIMIEGGLLDNSVADAIAGCRSLVSLSLPRCGVRDEHLRRFVVLPRLRDLNLASNLVTDEGIAALGASANQLTSLDLSHSSITDASAKAIAKLVHLQSLSVADTVLTDQFVRHLESLVALQVLNANNTQLTGESILRLANGKAKLSRLSLAGCKLGAFPALRYPHSLSGLQALDLSLAEITDAKRGAFPTLSELRIFRCVHASIPTDLLAECAQLRELRTIDAASCLSLTDEVVTAWGKCGQLTSVNISYCKVTDQSLLAFQHHGKLEAITIGSFPQRGQVPPVSQFTLNGLQAISKCQSLKEVTIVGPSIKAEWIEYLARQRPKITITIERTE